MDNFMSTEIPQNKIFIKKRAETDSVQKYSMNDSLHVHRVFNETPIKRAPRRWNSKGFGSIFRQGAVSYKELSNSGQNEEIPDESSSYNPSSHNKSRSGHIRHFKT